MAEGTRPGSVPEPHALETLSAEEQLPDIPKYTIFSKLAVGGMAEIFVGQRTGSSDVCVIKRLLEHHAADPVVGSRFLREARVASELNHPFIARLTDAGDLNGNLYLAMEFIAGQDVESMMFKLMEQRKMLPPQLSVSCALDVLEGLHYAHDYRSPDGRHLEIVHRDLSPRNVMITYEGEVKIIDFGLARTNLGDFRTAPGMVLGTLRYMSPEQAVAEPVDRRSDIYSWGVVVYEMLSGRPLVMGANANEVLRAVVTHEPPPLTSINPAMPSAVDPVLARALSKDRRSRFANALEFKLALEEATATIGRADMRLVGQFVRDLYPAEHARTSEMLEKARQGDLNEATQVLAGHEITRAQAYEPTQIGPGPIEPAVLPTVLYDEQEASYGERPAWEPLTNEAYPTATFGLPVSSTPGTVTRTRPRPPSISNKVIVAVGAAAMIALLVVSFKIYSTMQEPVVLPAEPGAKVIPQAPQPEVSVAARAQPVEAPARSVEPLREAAPRARGAAPVRAEREAPVEKAPAEKAPAAPKVNKDLVEFAHQVAEDHNNVLVTSKAGQFGLSGEDLNSCSARYVWTVDLEERSQKIYDCLLSKAKGRREAP